MSFNQKPREKKCKYCGSKFIPFNSFQKFCFNSECIKAHNETERAVKAKKAKKVYKEQDKSLQLKLAQTIVNKYIRLRDLNKPCVSCGYVFGSRQAHASHFKPVGNNQQLRFNTLNIWKSCSICNTHLSGNLVPYRKNLIKKLGLKKVEEIENNHDRGNYTVEYLHRLIRVFKKKIKLYERKFR